MNLALRDFDSADFRDDADQDWTDLAISNEPDVAPKAPVRDLLLSDQRVNGSATMWIGGASSAAVPFADTVPGGISSLATVAVGSSVDVVVETIGDHDWYRVTLNAGTTYTIQTSFDGSGTDAFLNLRDSAGTLILSDDDSGESNNSLISYTPTSTGT